MTNVVPFPGDTTMPEPTSVTLEKAKEWGMERCIIIGFGKDGDEIIFGGSFSDLGDMLILLEKAKLTLVASL